MRPMYRIVIKTLRTRIEKTKDLENKREGKNIIKTISKSKSKKIRVKKNNEVKMEREINYGAQNHTQKRTTLLVLREFFQKLEGLRI